MDNEPEDVITISDIQFRRPRGATGHPWRSASGIELQPPPGRARPDKSVEPRLRKCHGVELVRLDEDGENVWHAPAFGNHVFVKGSHHTPEKINEMVKQFLEEEGFEPDGKPKAKPPKAGKKE